MAATMRVLCTYLSLCSTLCGFGGLAIPTDYGPRHISTDSIPQSSNGSLTYGPHYAGDESLPTQLAKRALLEQRCSGRDARLLASALIDAQQMLEQMIQRSEELVEWLSDFPDEAPDDEELWSALFTFEAIFGQVWGDERITEEGIDDVEAQIEAARLLLEAINPAGSGAPPTVEFYCDHRQWTIHQDGKLYWDRRPLEKRGQRDIVFWHVCRADPEGMVAFTTHFNWEEGEESDGPIQNEVITFCPEALQGFVEEPLRTYRRRILADDETHLDILASERMAVNLVHELSHLDTVLGGLRFTDVEYPDGPNGKAYGFEGIQYLDSGDSQNNAESFAYFVTAMFLNNNDFHKGWSSMF